jgi:hypothetical protein
MRRVLVLAPLALVAAFMAMPGAAHAAPKPSPSPTPSPREPVHSVHITGDGLPGTIELNSVRDKQREAAVRSEVDWLATVAGNTTALLFYQLGPKYTVVLLNDDKAYLTFDLYPMAQGGPRVYRPSTQPDGHEVAEGWLYGRLSMPATLYAAGVPLNDVPVNPGGEGGGAPASEAPDLPGMLGSWRDFMGLNIAIGIIVAAGVFALAYVLRQRV